MKRDLGCWILIAVVSCSLQTWAAEETAPAAGTPASGTAGLAATQGAITQGESALKQAETLQQLDASKQKLTEGTKGCDTAVDAAKNACVESLSPFLQAAITGLTAAMAAQQGSTGTGSQCQSAQQAQQPAQQNMQSYNADCTKKKTECEQKCSQASQGADTVNTATCKADAEKIKNETQKKLRLTECQKAAQANKAANDKGKSACSSLSQNQSAGMAGIASLLSGLMKSASCQEEVAVDCVATPTATGCPQALDCNLEANAANPTCLCQKNPRLAGCGADAVSSTTSDPTNTASTNDEASTSALSNATDATPASYSSNGTGGGGGSVPGSSGGGAASMKSAADPAEKSIKPKSNEVNVLEGGGGGGSSATANGHAANDDAGMGKYSEYLPQEKKTILADQVSGAAGLSNWEKVRRRYSENRSKLIVP